MSSRAGAGMKGGAGESAMGKFGDGGGSKGGSRLMVRSGGADGGSGGGGGGRDGDGERCGGVR
jgi:hypothetical protein